MRAYYFTSTQYGIENLLKRRLKISRLPELNDPFELLSTELSTETLRIAFSESMRQWSEMFGVICFSKGSANPLLWSHYGDRHRGICLGFDLANQYVMPITYSPDRLKLDIERRFSEGTLNESVESIMRQILATKFQDWAYEDEVRMWLRLEEPDSQTNLFFKEFCADIALREVILGPRCKLSTQEVQEAIGTVDNVQAYRSRLSFSSFRVEPSECIFR